MDTLRTLDREVKFDERSRQYNVADTLEAYPTSYRPWAWFCTVWNDQGVEGACVGYAFSHELAAAPFPLPATAATANTIYKIAKTIDEWDGEDYSGTSIIAGAKATMKFTSRATGKVLMGSYRWSFDINDMIRAVCYLGPVVLGCAWYDGMWDVNANGFITPTGAVAGGHAILVRGFRPVLLDSTKAAVYANIDKDKSYFLLHNSWGKDWGMSGVFAGCARVSVRDMEFLLAQQGEVCVPLMRAA